MKTVTDYEQQAKDFCKKTGTQIKVEFVRYGRYFDGDKEDRDIYRITITRGTRSYTTEFGQSLNDSGFYYTKGVQKIMIDRSLLEKPKQQILGYIRKKDWSFLNNGKSDIIHFPKAPTEYDFLACVTKYDPDTFDDFCADFGYNDRPLSDYPKVQKIYHAVEAEYKAMLSLYSDEEMELLREIA